MTLVPMCGEHAETIAAPPIHRAAHTTILRATPCAAESDGLALGALPEPVRPERVPPLESIPRVLPVWYDLSPRPASGRLAHDTARSGERSGFPRAIERPPCA